MLSVFPPATIELLDLPGLGHNDSQYYLVRVVEQMQNCTRNQASWNMVKTTPRQST